MADVEVVQEEGRFRVRDPVGCAPDQHAPAEREDEHEQDRDHPGRMLVNDDGEEGILTLSRTLLRTLAPCRPSRSRWARSVTSSRPHRRRHVRCSRLRMPGCSSSTPTPSSSLGAGSARSPMASVPRGHPTRPRGHRRSTPGLTDLQAGCSRLLERRGRIPRNGRVEGPPWSTVRVDGAPGDGAPWLRPPSEHISPW